MFVRVVRAFRDRLLDLIPVYLPEGRAIAQLPVGEPLPDEPAALALCELATRAWMVAELNALESYLPHGELEAHVLGVGPIATRADAARGAEALEAVGGAITATASGEHAKGARELAVRASGACRAAAGGRWEESAALIADALYVRISGGEELVVTEVRRGLEAATRISG